MQLLEALRALADPTRLRIMRLLAEMELAVGELAQVLGQSQPRVSRHIRILSDSGLLVRRKEGSWVFLRAPGAADPAHDFIAATAAMLQHAELQDEEFARQTEADRAQLAAIRAAREASAAEYFARHAAEWDRLRSMHAADEPVEEALLAKLGSASLGALLDIGTGTGRMAQLLAPRADHVVGLDKSPEMLRLARARLQDQPPEKVELVHGDFAALPFAPASFDTVLFHQVLHYAQEPSLALAEAARVTRPGGRLAIVDFAAHEREELRTRDAHVRLGFADRQMRAMLTEAGFAAEEPATLAGHPLTVKIWTARRAASPATAAANRKATLP